MPLRLSRKLKKRQSLPLPEVNIVSLMDILTTLLFFLVIFASFSKYSSLNASALVFGKPSADQKQRFDLRIRFDHPKRATLLLGPFDKLKSSERSDLERLIGREFQREQDGGVKKTIYGKSTEDLVRRLQAVLIPIKKAFPHETGALVLVGDRIDYQEFVDLLGGVRELSPKEEPLTLTTLVGTKETSRVLFPGVSVGEWN